MKVLESKQQIEILPNIASMLKRNLLRYGNKIAYSERRNRKYEGIKWIDLYKYIKDIACGLRKLGFNEGDKMVLFSRNRQEMLIMELAVMASGGIAVPIFSNFKQHTAELLIKHSDAKFLAVEGQQQLNNISPNLSLKQIFVFEDIREDRFPNLMRFNELIQKKADQDFNLNIDADPNEICLNMYTSGTMGTPKCVQLTHKNILSQQAALDILWDIDENDRFLSYLPWHHSFGGIFELFTALYHGAKISLESSYGKDPAILLENWQKVMPTVFFSVPKIYKELIELTEKDQAAEKMFFNSGLKFIFTAAAALPENVSDEFKKRNIPVIEGWGLTETSPCCTLTDSAISRESGVVGNPIPGVSLRIADDNEIQVKGPNVMVGYYKNDEANQGIWTDDGWFKTGDVGEITSSGLKLISRKDRIFKLSNGEKVIPTDLEKIIELKCHYISYAIVAGKGKDYPVALIFPNKKVLHNPDYDMSPLEGCFCPRNLNELGKCLSGCLKDANCGIHQKFAKIRSAAIIDDELSLEKNTITPSLKLAPNKVLETYKNHLKNLYGDNVPVEEDVYLIELDQKVEVNI